MNYTEQLTDGRWQKKRLEIFQRDNFKCRCCKTTNKLTVHHLYYVPKTMIWDYDDEGLITICKECHNKITFDLAKLSGIIAFKILTGEFDLFNLFNEIDYKSEYTLLNIKNK